MRRKADTWTPLLLALLATCGPFGSPVSAQRGPLPLERSVRPHAPERHAPQFRADVRLVLVPVVVVDPLGRIVNGLERENFRIFDEGQEQAITAFSSEDAPASVGLVLDLSGSMEDKLAKTRGAIRALFDVLNPEDEVFLVTLADRPKLGVDYTSDFAKVQNRLLFSKAEGRTALIDAVYSALHHMTSAQHSRKALVVISDGGDNSSRYTLGELKSYAREADTQIYAIGIHSIPRTLEELHGPFLLADIAEETGGRDFAIRDLNELADVAAKIGLALHNQYLIGYPFPDDVAAGKYRKIRLKLKVPKALPRLHVYARRGYYAPES